MGISLNEVFPLSFTDGNISGITKMEMMASLGDFQISKLRNDGAARGTHNFTRHIIGCRDFGDEPEPAFSYYLSP